MLTGLEQYSLERAGYFIRRGFLSHELVERALAVGDSLRKRTADRELLDTLAQAVAGVAELAADILGPDPRLARISVGEDSLADPTWTRGFGTSWNESATGQTAALARTMEHIQARIALTQDESLVLQPGTHAAPPAPEDLAALRLNPSGDAPGQVRVRLASGDALFWNTNVLHKMDGQSPAGMTIRVTFVARNFLPDTSYELWDEGETDMAERFWSSMEANG